MEAPISTGEVGSRCSALWTRGVSVDQTGSGSGSIPPRLGIGAVWAEGSEDRKRKSDLLLCKDYGENALMVENEQNEVPELFTCSSARSSAPTPASSKIK
ncbi:hypothetical protein TREES_T100016644 [Tupaia chinensis]|uniref:Uncharacterized protein n=1 Tax=Tupaia chinensis TaxID=246437 RepID=L9L7S6_TUPCH|nr:hypothetical protein TREES_T100016644 [Tupaia chinensis]